ncbi:exosortase A [Spartinivicinus poritis]|uniref:Exosortase A n=1 Tax=Spartinivicinus poritis TaxID=2994640 RepID=A0ABT5UGQ0_9GAMM|nr:exosortase A [Spartinivicinus sp. A2-2]MDE1464608.1 exosortase A [Spartinivicinus sp. A2-2]
MQVSVMTTSTDSKRPLYWLVVALLVWLAAYFPTLHAMVTVWLNSETYAHGLLIVPMSLFLLWQKRKQLNWQLIRPSWLPLLPLLFLSAIWFIANVSGINVIQQFAVVLMIPLLVWSCLGTAITRQIVFPLGYLLFAVPMGSGIVPYLQEITAWFCVWGLKLIGIPVFWEGLYISIPSGDFLVAEACSGIRYLIASMALGTFYAYISYTSLSKRLAVFGLSIIIPIVANGIRAFGIILIAYYSNMEYATGADHLLYGWIFFGIVMMLLFWLGSKFADDMSSANTADQQTVKHDNEATTNPLTILAVLAVVAVLPLWAAIKPTPTAQQVSLKVDTPVNWQSAKPSSTWAPTFSTSQQLRQAWQEGNQEVELFIAHYPKEQAGSELVSFANKVYNEDAWKLLGTHSTQLQLGDITIYVKEYRMESFLQQRLIWSWYFVNNTTQSDQYRAKFQQTLAKILNRPAGGSFVALSTEYEFKPDEARAVLTKFLQATYPSIVAAVTPNQ